MTREETVDLIRSLVSLYPNWKPDNLTETVNAWHWALEEYPAPAIKAALQIYLKTDKTGFAPSAQQLISSMYSIKEKTALSEGEAWNIVKRALQDSTYHANERFEDFPETIKKAVGSANMLQQWAQAESKDVNTVIMSNFQRSYKTVCEREQYLGRIPEQISNLLTDLTNKTSGRIEAHG